MRRLFILFAGLLVLVVAVWLVVYDADKLTPAADPAAPSLSPVPRSEVELAPPAHQQPSTRVEKTEAKTAPRAEADGEVAADPARESLKGRVVDDLGFPVATGRVEARTARDRHQPPELNRRVVEPTSNDVTQADSPKVVNQRRTLVINERGRGVTALNRPVYVVIPRQTKSVPVVDGAFRFEDLTIGEWEIVAFGEGDVRSQTVVHSMPSTNELAPLVVPRAATIRGTVESSDGAPLEGAVIYIWYSGQEAPSLFHATPEPHAQTDQRGRFELERLMPGLLAVKADHPNYAESEWVSVNVAPGGRAEELRIALDSGGRIIGLVDSSLGDIANRTVNLYSFRGSEGWRVTTTDNQGNFALENVIPQSYVIQLRRPGYPSSAPEGDAGIRIQIEVKANETTEVEFRADVPIKVLGTLSCNGVPLEGVRVFATPQDSAPDQQDECVTTPTGTFEISVSAPGKFWLTVDANQGSYNYVDLTVPGTEGVEVHLELPAGRITGVVLSPTGAPLSRVPVTLQPAPGGEPFALSRRAQRAMYTGRDGRFDFRFLEPSSYTLRSPDGFRRSSQPPVTPYGRVVASDLLIDEAGFLKDVELRLENEGRISGTVLDEPGSPVQGAWLYAQDSQTRFLSSDWETPTDASGNFQLRSIAAGTYTVIAVADGLAGEAVGVRVEAGKTASITVRLAPAE